MNKLFVTLTPSFRMPPFNAPLTDLIPHSPEVLRSMGSQRVRHNLLTEHRRHHQQLEGARPPQALGKRQVTAAFNKIHAQTCVHPPAKLARSSPALRGRRGGSPSWAASPSPAGRSPRRGRRTPPALGGRTVWMAGPAEPSGTCSSSRASSPMGEVGQGLDQSPWAPCTLPLGRRALHLRPAPPASEVLGGPLLGDRAPAGAAAASKLHPDPGHGSPAVEAAWGAWSWICCGGYWVSEAGQDLAESHWGWSIRT